MKSRRVVWCRRRAEPRGPRVNVMQETASPRASAFAGTERFQLRRLLGAGGMGVVFAAYDRDCRCEVALKLLPGVDPMGALRLKNEFRVASGIHHLNLVSLGELIEDSGHLFFTMELVEGVDWRAHLNGIRTTAPPSSSDRCGRSVTRTSPTYAADFDVDDGARSPRSERAPCAVDEGRLRSALRQLTEGLACLHAHGKVHRDVKPSNVLVSDKGRVVLLDFGLAIDVSHQASTGEGGHAAAGTALYMSPEQARRMPVGHASDWYSVGLLLYAALCGRLPFTGSVREILRRKQAEDPAAPADVVVGVPEDLNRLCVALLARDPDARASGADILSTLRGGAGTPIAVASSEPVTSRFVGRYAELNALQRAFDGAVREPLLVVVQGESGVGKTALVREFCRRLEDQGSPPPTLIGRSVCSERESVPYKALDGIAEALAHQLPAALDSIVFTTAARAAALAFPVLNRALGPAAGVPEVPRDPWVKRNIAYQGVRDLLTALAPRRRLVLCVDDWQWVDADSVRLLSHVLAQPDAPPMLLLLTSRPGAPEPALPCKQVRITLGNLEPDAAELLASRLLDGLTRGTRSLLARAIAAESLGHPLFIAALARQVHAGEALHGAIPNLEGAIWSRACALPALAREAVELLAVSRAPLSGAVLQSALSTPTGAPSWIDLTNAVAELTRDNLARADGVRPSDAIDCFHARVAGSILVRLSPTARRARHEALARALEQNDSSDFESMTEHWVEAGKPELGARYALSAADASATFLAFERAARLYRRCLNLAPAQPDVSAVHEKLAGALGHIGRGREAADAYLVAATEARDRRLELHRLAADQLFRSGYVEDAVRLIEQVFPSLGLRFPKSPRAALLGLSVRRIQVGVRGIGFRPRHVDAVAPDAIARVDAAWTVAVGLSTVDNLKGACVQSGNLLLALQLGEPFRVVRALAAEAAYVATVGVRSKPKVDTLLARANEIAHELNDPYALGFVHLARCFALYLRSEFTAARRAGEAAEAVFEQRPVMAAWELASARMLLLSSHFYSGDLAVLGRRVPELLREAESRGDLYGATCLRLGICNCAWLVDDDSEGARRNLRLADASWGYSGVHLQHGWSLVAWANVALYDDAPEEAYSRVQKAWPALERSFVMRFERLRAELHWLRARASLALARHETTARLRLLAQAERCGRHLLGESAAWAPAAGHLVLAGAHAIRGNALRARECLDLAERLARRCDVHFIGRLHAECTGQGTGFHGHVKRPDRWVRMLAPGLADVSESATASGEAELRSRRG